MDECPRRRVRKVLLFVLVCALHGVLCWFLLATSRIITLHTQPRSFELIVITPTQVPLPAPLTGKPRPAPPPAAHHKVVDSADAAGSISTAENNAITPSIDWNAELARAGRAASGLDPQNPKKDFGFPNGPPPTMADFPQFDWDYARTHRVESIPEGGVIIHLNDNCVLILSPLPFPFCSPFKRKANGELFKHMHDPDKPGDASIP